MLARAGLGDEPGLPHPLREQALAQTIVDLVRAGVQQVFALEINPRAAETLGQSTRLKQRRRAAREVFEQAVELGLKLWIASRRLVRLLQLLDWMHQRLRHKTPAEFTETSARVGPGAKR